MFIWNIIDRFQMIKEKPGCSDAGNTEKEQVAQLQNDCYGYMADFARLIYENEERREDSLIQQASHMQTAFSFVIAAVFMVAAIVVDNRGVLSLEYLLLAFSCITATLMFSLFSATMAQNRTKRDDFPKVNIINQKIIDEYENFVTPAQRSKYLVDTYEIMHISYAASNDKRRHWVMISMWSFYASLAQCIFWFIITLCKIL